MSRAVPLAGLALLALGGCMTLDPAARDSAMPQVPASPFPASVVQTVKRAKLNYTPADQVMGMRVDAVGRKLLTANADVGLRPRFATIGSAAPEIFHPDQSIVYITEGLVRQCRTEAELAAVLASELGRMVSEREAATARATRLQEPGPPLHLPIGGQGNPVGADPTYFVEIAKYEKEHPKAARNRFLPPPDPHRVSAGLLERAGFQKADLDTVAPLLRGAEKNCTLERQFKGIVGAEPAAAWRPQ